ncbi:MAG: diaminopimelate decarboxylase [Dehalococcoidales bacterium]|nr:diaminopimelate decarboxylase [Dehalococcoidales bacterium]
MTENIPRLVLFPENTGVNKQGHLVIGGCDTVELAKEFGTPLYVFDEAALRNKCTEYKTEFNKRYPGTTVLYAAKAFLCRAMANLIKEEGLGMDIVSGGEMGIAASVDFPLENTFFHGNNKSADELRQALQCGVGRIVVDNFHELKMLDKLSGEKDRRPTILLRITPGVDVHTHANIVTGNIDSKFGFPLVTAEEAIATAMSLPNLNLTGLHFHIGSLIYETEPYLQAIEYILNLAAEMKRKKGFALHELDIGGGYAVQYNLDTPPAPPASYFAEALTDKVKQECKRHGLPLPKLFIEPGRSVVARAGVALYNVGVVKDIPEVRTYVSVDGGMADNIRPALYGAVQEALLANRVKAKEAGKFTIAGKFCESGDILIKDLPLARPEAGDILAVPDCGAYCIPQACNYNASFKVAIVMVNEGRARLIRRRETLEDLIRGDIV